MASPSTSCATHEEAQPIRSENSENIETHNSEPASPTTPTNPSGTKEAQQKDASPSSMPSAKTRLQKAIASQLKPSFQSGVFSAAPITSGNARTNDLTNILVDAAQDKFTQQMYIDDGETNMAMLNNKRFTTLADFEEFEHERRMKMTHRGILRPQIWLFQKIYNQERALVLRWYANEKRKIFVEICEPYFREYIEAEETVEPPGFKLYAEEMCARKKAEMSFYLILVQCTSSFLLFLKRISPAYSMSVSPLRISRGNYNEVATCTAEKNAKELFVCQQCVMFLRAHEQFGVHLLRQTLYGYAFQFSQIIVVQDNETACRADILMQQRRERFLLQYLVVYLLTQHHWRVQFDAKRIEFQNGLRLLARGMSITDKKKRVPDGKPLHQEGVQEASKPSTTQPKGAVRSQLAASTRSVSAHTKLNAALDWSTEVDDELDNMCRTDLLDVDTADLDKEGTDNKAYGQLVESNRRRELADSVVSALLSVSSVLYTPQRTSSSDGDGSPSTGPGTLQGEKQKHDGPTPVAYAVMSLSELLLGASPSASSAAARESGGGGSPSNAKSSVSRNAPTGVTQYYYNHMSHESLQNSPPLPKKHRKNSDAVSDGDDDDDEDELMRERDSSPRQQHQLDMSVSLMLLLHQQSSARLAEGEKQARHQLSIRHAKELKQRRRFAQQEEFTRQQLVLQHAEEDDRIYLFQDGEQETFFEVEGMFRAGTDRQEQLARQRYFVQFSKEKRLMTKLSYTDTVTQQAQELTEQFRKLLRFMVIHRDIFLVDEIYAPLHYLNDVYNPEYVERRRIENYFRKCHRIVDKLDKERRANVVALEAAAVPRDSEPQQQRHSALPPLRTSTTSVEAPLIDDIPASSKTPYAALPPLHTTTNSNNFITAKAARSSKTPPPLQQQAQPQHQHSSVSGGVRGLDVSSLSHAMMHVQCQRRRALAMLEAAAFNMLVCTDFLEPLNRVFCAREEQRAFTAVIKPITVSLPYPFPELVVVGAASEQCALLSCTVWHVIRQLFDCRYVNSERRLRLRIAAVGFSEQLWTMFLCIYTVTLERAERTERHLIECGFTREKRQRQKLQEENRVTRDKRALRKLQEQETLTRSALFLDDGMVPAQMLYLENVIEPTAREQAQFAELSDRVALLKLLNLLSKEVKERVATQTHLLLVLCEEASHILLARLLPQEEHKCRHAVSIAAQRERRQREAAQKRRSNVS